MMKPNSIYTEKFCGGRLGSRVFCLSLAIFLSFFSSAAQNVSAQKRIPKRRTTEKITVVKPQVKNSIDDAAKKQKTDGILTNTAITVVNRAEADYLTGEVSVSVNPKQPTVIRLGLAQNAVSVVEFPAIDRIYYIHEGNPKLVTVFQSPTKETDRSITLYPGEGFLTGASGQKELSATITLQMKSGLVIVLEIVPAPDIRSNAHRCVLNYNLGEVVAARQAAGLKVNLGDDEMPKPLKQTRAISRLVTGSISGDGDLQDANGEANLQPSAVVEIGAGNTSSKTDAQNNSKSKMKTGAPLARVVNKKLAEAIKQAKEKFTSWSSPVKGLSLSTLKIVEIDDWQRLLIIAVKNETTEGLRLLEEMPEIQIQTADKSGNSLQLERLTRKYVETTALQGAIPAGATVYYAVVFENPILGANQKLLVSAAHDRASDAPVVATTANQLDKKGDGNK
jgi:hypothetical protein